MIPLIIFVFGEFGSPAFSQFFSINKAAQSVVLTTYKPVFQYVWPATRKLVKVCVTIPSSSHLSF